MAASKLFFLKSALRSRISPQNDSLIRMVQLRRLSTEGEKPQDASEVPFLRSSEEGRVAILHSRGSHFEFVSFNIRYLILFPHCRPGFPAPIRVSLVHFPTRIDAMNAFCWKNRSFCLNNPITMRVLQ
ncbi:hypothetical protein B296_00056413 [Ensete ventricosum]|uniref:Uncharacterized protein n=1 Tax=Ensete ventricosum TaxID=4639 RepID=A0A426XVD7_ENSVE|nr:hypothetical protein B296_00056413 [Ensete ventricosum]